MWSEIHWPHSALMVIRHRMICLVTFQYLIFRPSYCFSEDVFDRDGANIRFPLMIGTHLVKFYIEIIFVEKLIVFNSLDIFDQNY